MASHAVAETKQAEVVTLQASTRSKPIPHPGVWWLWAGLIAAGATKIHSPLLLLALCIVVTGVGYRHRYSQQHWQSFKTLLVVAGFIVVGRVILQIIFGANFGNDVIVRLPSFSLPSWLTGVRIGGPVTQQSLLGALNNGLALAITIAVIAAAVAMTSSTTILRLLPASFEAFATVVIIAITFIPQLFDDIQRLRTAHRLRGSTQGPLRLIGMNIFNLADTALRRSVTLAGSLSTRGYQLRSTPSPFLLTSLCLMALSLGRATTQTSIEWSTWFLAIAALAFLAVHFRFTQASSHRTRFIEHSLSYMDGLLVFSGLLFLAAAALEPLIAVLACAIPLMLHSAKTVESTS